MIKVENLTKSFGPFVAVDNISFNIDEHEVVGLLGPNGAGKTTTMRMLTGYLAPTSGKATLAGLESSIETKKILGYLPENAPLYEDMRVLDFLRFIANIREIPKEKRKERLRYVLDVCGLKHMISRPISHLSKGYRQRVGLAQALIHDPKILILDEPTSGLDPNQIQEIRKLIKDIGKEKTVILSTHIMQEVKAVCSKVLIMSDGRIVASGTQEELQSKHSAAHRVEVHIQGNKDDIKHALSSIEGVSKIGSAATGRGDVHGFTLESESSQDLRPIIFKKAVSNHWVILEMHRKDLDLEELFSQLTSPSK